MKKVMKGMFSLAILFSCIFLAQRRQKYLLNTLFNIESKVISDKIEEQSNIHISVYKTCHFRLNLAILIIAIPKRLAFD